MRWQVRQNEHEVRHQQEDEADHDWVNRLLNNKSIRARGAKISNSFLKGKREKQKCSGEEYADNRISFSIPQAETQGCVDRQNQASEE